MPVDRLNSIQAMADRLRACNARYPDAVAARDLEKLPLRQDLVTLLSFVRDNKVIGTQAAGNIPMAAVRQVTARFVDPPPLERPMGQKTFRIRSESQLWPLFFLHVLAEVGRLMKTGAARRWRVTQLGQQFLRAEPSLQVPFLLATWWYRVNWLIAYPFTGLGERLPYRFPEKTLARLRSLPTGTPIPFPEFADQLIADTGLTWGVNVPEITTSALRGAIKRMVIYILSDFGLLTSRYQSKPSGAVPVVELAEFTICPTGMTLLDVVDVIGG